MPRKAGPEPYQVDVKGRVALPPAVKAVLDVGVGDYVVFEVEGKAVRIRKVKISVE